MPLLVHLSDLEQALHHLLQELRQKKGEVIEIDPVDYYWSIPLEELYDPYRDPTQLTLGQLAGDLEEMKKIAHREAEPISQDFVKMSAILAAIGHKTIC